MPIRVEYQPVDALGEAAYLGGLGQYQQQQQQMMLHQQAQQQQAALAQQQLAAHSYSQQQQQLANQQSQMFQAQNQWALHGAGFDADMQKLDAQHDFTAEQNQAQRDQHAADLQAQRDAHMAEVQATIAGRNSTLDARNGAAKQKQLWDYTVASGDNEHKAIDGYLSDIAKQIPNMSEAGKAKYADLTAKFQGISKFNDSGMMRPEQYLSSMAQFRQELSKANLESTITPPTNAAQEVAQRVHTDPATGNQYILQPSGEIRPVPAKPNPPPGKDYAKFVDSFVGKAKKVITATGEEGSAEYTADDIRKLWETRKKAMEMISGTIEEKPQPSPVEAAAAQVIQAIMAMQQQAGQAGQGIPPNGSPPPQPDSGNLPQQPPAVPPQQQPAPPSQQMPEPTMGPQRVPTVPAKTKAEPVKIDHLTTEQKKVALANLPRPASEEERLALPRGMKYIAPDGTLRISSGPPTFGVSGGW
jgi:hypothetical protein